ncbi:hypothetical protein AAF712_005926 [Marasmius tenuissimus]|uniref:Zn(2)-C6 fungal-type domain-containing protein n=1 Tax=Marasmius tenuissimus TaxID=585030 RepID=A0ABR3A0R6_9AGAR
MAPKAKKILEDASSMITEEMKSRFSDVYNQKGPPERRRLWRKENTKEPCEQCDSRNVECTPLTGHPSTSVRCAPCFKTHYSCSLTNDYRKSRVMETMKITGEQFDALEKWYKVEGKAKPKPKTKAKATIVTSQADSDSELSSLEDGPEDAENGGESQRTSATLRDEKTTTRTGSRIDSTSQEKDCSPEASESIAGLSQEYSGDDSITGEFMYPPNSQESISPEPAPSSTLTGADTSSIHSASIPPESCKSLSFSPSFWKYLLTNFLSPVAQLLAVQLQQLKREIQEITTSLRFRRATRDGTIDFYDQTALKLGDIMAQSGVEE